MMTLRAYRIGTRLSNALWLALFAALFAKFCWNPTTARGEEARAELASAENKISRMKSRAARLYKLENDLLELTAAAAVLDPAFPKPPPTPGELEDYRKLARKHGVVISELNQAPLLRQTGLAGFRHEAGARASAWAMEDFLAHLPSQGRLTRVGNLTMGPADSTGMRAAAFDLILYQRRY